MAGLELRVADAATWPVPASELSASLGFHDTYSAGDSSYAHSGMDIPASAGMQISTPLAGTVSFTGAVPSGDSRTSGAPVLKTMRAVSVKLASGKTVTLMPFDSIDVSRGQWVAEGEALGTLAAAGDVSTQGAHLHMGLKEDGVYYDPLSLFGQSAHVSDAVPAGQAQESAAPAQPVATPALPDDAKAQTRSSRARESASGEAAADLAGAPVTEAPHAAAEGSWEPGRVSSGDAVWQRPVQRGAAGPLEALDVAARAVVGACTSQASLLVDGLGALARETGMPLVAVCFCAVALLAAVLATGMYAARRWAVPLVSSLWRLRIAPLYRRSLGASMHKLFPAPGSAFITRGR